jgi:hypothetical protein
MKARKTTTKGLHTYLIRSAAFVNNRTIFKLVLIASVFTLLMACKKNKDQPEPEPPGDKNLLVNFSTTTIDYSLVDSAFVILKKAGSAQQIFKRFEKHTATLLFSIDDLSAGNWTAEMYIFARFNTSAGRRYRQDKTFTIPGGGARDHITLAAPTGSITDAWKPYAFFRHEAEGVSIAVALDNTDPHFDIQVSNTKWDLYYIERYANNRQQGGANAKVAEYIWSCDTGCYTSDKFINNNTGFLPFTQDVGNKDWNNGLIIVVIADNEGPDVQFSHVYNK